MHQPQARDFKYAMVCRMILWRMTAAAMDAAVSREQSGSVRAGLSGGTWLVSACRVTDRPGS